MTYTIWSAGQLIGHTSLERSAVGAGTRAGAFRPTPAFDAVWPVLRTFHALLAETTADFRGMPAGSSGEEIHAWLMAQPTAEAFAASGHAVAALGLELRDPAGAAMPGVRVLISESIPLTVIHQVAEVDADGAQDLVRQMGADWPKYMVAVVPDRNGGATSAE